MNAVNPRLDSTPAKKVLIVDDNPDIRRLIRFTLGDAFEVIEAENGEAALLLVREHQPDLVILDIMMPGAVDGLLVLERIKTNPDWRHILVILVTARGQVDDIRYGEAKGADAYFVKPFSPMNLLNWVRTRLA